jgi:hypothetical protein
MVTTFVRPEIYDRIYKNGPDVIFAGSLRPGGKAEEIGNSRRLNGRWGFASGCQHADWMYCAFEPAWRESVKIVPESETDVVSFSVFEDRWLHRGNCTLIGERQNGILHQPGPRDEASTRPAATAIRARTRVETKQAPASAT